LEGRFGGASKMEGHLEALLEMDFCTKPPNFGVEAHMEAPAGDALRDIHPLILQVLEFEVLKDLFLKII
jgi:hypothetical protein